MGSRGITLSAVRDELVWIDCEMTGWNWARTS